MPCCFSWFCRNFICVSAFCCAEKDAFTPGPQSVSVNGHLKTHTHKHTHWCCLTWSHSKLACQERHWTFLNEYQRHRWWRWRWNSSSYSGTETRAHKERKCSFCCLRNVFFTCFIYTRTYVQVYTRSVIDPIPAPNPCVDGDMASKAADRQKKKGKMSDEEIMDKLSKLAF